MKTKSYSVYTFDELSKKAKEYAKQKYYENEDYPWLEDEYMSVCKAPEKEGYATLEYRMTDEEFSEHCEINGYEFTEDGKLD